MKSKITAVSLDSILFLGKFEYTFELGPYKIIYNLASVGDKQDSLNAVTHGVLHEQAASIATSLMSVNGYNFTTANNSDSFMEKFRFLRNLKSPVFDLFWDEYQAAIALQYKQFDEFMSNAKKSVPTQPSETDGSSSNV